VPEPRSIGDRRSTITFIVLVLLSLISLASGARGGVLGTGIKTVVGVAVMPFLSAVNALENGGEYVSGLFSDYDELRDELDAFNRKFTEQQLKTSEYYEFRAENERLRKMLNFARASTEYQLLAAEVIQHSQGVLTVDQGSTDGVRESMCVIAPNGIIGLVTHVGPFTSSVITLQNADCRVDAMIDGNRVRGQVQGTANDLSSVCAMHYIDLNKEVRDGDLIVTSPDSVFPSGYLIGRVLGNPRQDNLSQSANIALLADPFRVDEVFILLNLNRSADDIAGTPSELENVSVTAQLADTESIQERFAP
jgi:rod shape-determining protein MreC